jgi:hypothetical protein
MMKLLPVLAAAIAAFVFGGIWYTLLSKRWLAAMGKAEIKTGNWGPEWAPYVINFVSQLIIAFVFARLLSHMGGARISITTGLMAGALLWLGFIATTLVTNHSFQNARPRLSMIDGGHWLGVMLIQGAVLALLS